MEDLPANVSQHLPAAIADAEDALLPANPKFVMVMLDRLFAEFPMPDKAGLEGWKRELSRYPADLIEAAIDEVIRTHVWENRPKIAEVVTRIRPEIIERQTWKNKLGTALLKARMTERGRKESKAKGGKTWAELSPEERAAHDRMMANWRQNLASRESEMVPAYDRMSPAAKERVREERAELEAGSDFDERERA